VRVKWRHKLGGASQAISDAPRSPRLLNDRDHDRLALDRERKKPEFHQIVERALDIGASPLTIAPTGDQLREKGIERHLFGVVLSREPEYYLEERSRQRLPQWGENDTALPPQY
jgi:hypothetical protein